MTFEKLNLVEPILKALRQEGYETPTPIQEKAIPYVLAGKDLLGCAQTGTGKTAAFSIPILQHLYERGNVRGRREIKALVLTPTRELAIQIDESFAAYGRHTGVSHLVVFGGVSQVPQVEMLRKGVDVLVATPGRLLDLIQQRYIDLRTLEYFVLDEADRMLDMGFIHDIKRILPLLPSKRQTLFFSATMPVEIAKLADSMLRDPMKVAVTPPASTVDMIDQSVYFVEKNDKKELMIALLQDPSIESALVFSRTKYGADKIARFLSKEGILADAIHGEKSQTARQRALSNFKEHKIRVLVATDIAARGIDVDELSHVINNDLPEVAETYVHRIGRTGRAGHSGVAISFCSSEELPLLKEIQKLIGKKIPVVSGHTCASPSAEKAHQEAEKKLVVKAKENKIFRGSRATGDFWRRKKRNAGQ
ncbi:MAG: DEAD/DEAH box helicase [Odoribacter sp.]